VVFVDFALPVFDSLDAIRINDDDDDDDGYNDQDKDAKSAE